MSLSVNINLAVGLIPCATVFRLMVPKNLANIEFTRWYGTSLRLHAGAVYSRCNDPDNLTEGVHFIQGL